MSVGRVKKGSKIKEKRERERERRRFNQKKTYQKITKKEKIKRTRQPNHIITINHKFAISIPF